MSIICSQALVDKARAINASFRFSGYFIADPPAKRGMLFRRLALLVYGVFMMFLVGRCCCLSARTVLRSLEASGGYALLLAALPLTRVRSV